MANLIGYPVLVRPSYVLGGRAMEIVNTPDDLRRFVTALLAQDQRYPVLIDKYLQGREVEVDAICDGTDTLIPGIMEHIERAGVHSGDSFAVYPPIHLTAPDIERIFDYTTRICAGLEARGLINIQYVLHQGEVYVLEVNPRSSRTVPFLSKVTGVPMVRLATQVMLGRRLADLGFGTGLWPARPLVAVKAPVFSMAKLVGVDTFLGPEMKSTGEVMGVDSAFAPALRKAMIAAGVSLPPEGGVLLSIADRDKAEVEPIIRALGDAGYRLYATAGTAALVRRLGYDVTAVGKLTDGDQTIINLIRSGRTHLVVNTVTGGRPVLQDGFEIPAGRCRAPGAVPDLAGYGRRIAGVDDRRQRIQRPLAAGLSHRRRRATTGGGRARRAGGGSDAPVRPVRRRARRHQRAASRVTIAPGRAPGCQARGRPFEYRNG